MIPAARRRALLGAVLVMSAGGCAYYNGIYNARTATRRADALVHRGLDDSAAVLYARAADAAETVLARRDAASWRREALLLAGRGAALSGACDRAAPRLEDFLADTTLPDTVTAKTAIAGEERVRAALALAVCEAREERFGAAAARLAALDANDPPVSPALHREVRRWRARVALARGETALADSLHAALDPADAPWDRIEAAAASGAWPRADSLLALRAAAGDARPALDGVLRRAAAAGEIAFVSRVADVYAASGAPRAVRARVQVLAGEAARTAGDSARARRHFAHVVERAGARTDTVSLREAWAGLLYLDLMTADSAPALRPLLSAARPLARGAAGFDRLETAAALFLILHDTDDPSGAAHYLAGEVARDSLHLPRLAVRTWRTLVERWPDAPLAPRALYAASLVSADSAARWREELLTRYSGSAMTALVRGEGMAGAADQRAADALLQGRWVIATRALEDTLRGWREQAGGGEWP